MPATVPYISEQDAEIGFFRKPLIEESELIKKKKDFLNVCENENLYTAMFTLTTLAILLQSY